MMVNLRTPSMKTWVFLCSSFIGMLLLILATIVWRFAFSFGWNWLCGFGKAKSGYQAMLVEKSVINVDRYILKSYKLSAIVVRRSPSVHAARRPLYGTLPQQRHILWAAAAMQCINTKIRLMFAVTHCTDFWSWAVYSIGSLRIAKQWIVVKKASRYKLQRWHIQVMQIQANPV